MASKIEIILCVINIIAAFLGLIIFIITSTKKEIKHTLKRLPRILRYYLITSCYPAAIILSITSIVTSSFYIFFGSNIDYKVLRVLLAFTGEQFRFSLLAMAIERILATIYLENYCKFSSDPLIFVLMIAISYGSSLLYIIFLGTWTIVFTEKDINYWISSIALCMHAVILIIGKVLRTKNKNMYALLAYRVSLKRRYQILENIKVLNFLYPKILIFTIFAPLGPLASLIFDLVSAAPVPVGLYHLPYNISFVLMGLYRLMNLKSRKRIHPVSGVEKNVLAIISPLGNRLPVNIPIDHYFENLQRQWM